MTQIDVSALSIHTQSGPQAGTEAVAGLVMQTVVGAESTEEWISAVAMHALRGGRVGMEAVDMVVMQTIFGPPTVSPPPTGTGSDPDILPPDECNETGNPSCCVPDLNRVIEARVGVLNSHHDLVVAIQYLQDRHNVLVREFNKLALVTRPNPPSV